MWSIKSYIGLSMSDYYKHDTSVIDTGAIIGDGTKVWHFCHISSTATIGSNCTLGQNVYIGPKVRIGNGVKIQNNVSVYEGVILEDDVFIGPSVVFTNVKLELLLELTRLLSVEIPSVLMPL